MSPLPWLTTLLLATTLLHLISSQSPNPQLDFFSPRGLRISIQGPYRESSVYKLKFYVNINEEFNGVERGQYEGDETVFPGGTWSYTFRDVKVSAWATVYYWVVVTGKLGLTTWKSQYKGYNQVAGDPHVNAPLLDYTPRPPQYQPPPVYPTKAPSTDVRDPFETCRKSLTTFNNGKSTCVGDLFVDVITLESVEQIGQEPEEAFTVFSHDNIFKNIPSYDNASQEAIKPTLLEDKYGPFSVDENITLNQCTSKNSEHCSYSAMGYFILPPIISGRETTQWTLSFRYGVLEVTAKLPQGDWIVPELWLLPKNRVYGENSGRIVLAMSRGNLNLKDADKDYSNGVLEAGVEIGSGRPSLFRMVQNRPWSDDYHKFKMIWTPDHIQFFVDNNEIGQWRGQNKDPTIRGSKLAPFDQEFYLSFGVHVGGDKDFPDSLKDKPWINSEPKNKLRFWQARDKWLETWKGDTSLYIAGISLAALEF